MCFHQEKRIIQIGHAQSILSDPLQCNKASAHINEYKVGQQSQRKCMRSNNLYQNKMNVLNNLNQNEKH